MSIYEFTVKSIEKQTISLSQYKGNVVLIVNTASKCGFTPQYEELEALYQKYKKDGFMILAFPCNQFLNQEPEDNHTIQEFCRKNYGVTFPVFEKIDVNGEHAISLYQYLTGEIGFEGFDMEHPLGQKLDEILSAENQNYKDEASIKWNFTKFLIDRNGSVRQRFEPTAPMYKVEEAVKNLL